MYEVAARDDVQGEKRALREEMRRLRAAVTPAAARLAGDCAASLLATHLDREDEAGRAGIRIALLYAPLPGELDTALIDELLRSRGTAIAYPRVDGDLLRLHFAAPSDLVRGRFAIAGPPSHLPSVAAGDLDLVLVPALAFDRRGHRLGFGRGFYDRLLAAAPAATRLGACLPHQLVPRLPDEPHDVAVDFILVGAPPERGGDLIATQVRATQPGRAVPSKENH